MYICREREHEMGGTAICIYAERENTRWEVPQYVYIQRKRTNICRERELQMGGTAVCIYAEKEN
jgi:hypothetical protein